MAARRWRPAYIGIGANLAQPAEAVSRACRALADLDGCCGFTVSALYRSAPVGPQSQDDFINAVAALLTVLDAHALLAEMQAIEARHGRLRDGVRWGPRVIDLDLLMLSDIQESTHRLTLPHAHIAERRFVIEPWQSLCPTLVVPGVGALSQLLPGVDDQLVVRVADAPC